MLSFLYTYSHSINPQLWNRGNMVRAISFNLVLNLFMLCLHKLQKKTKTADSYCTSCRLSSSPTSAPVTLLWTSKAAAYEREQPKWKLRSSDARIRLWCGSTWLLSGSLVNPCSLTKPGDIIQVCTVCLDSYLLIGGVRKRKQLVKVNWSTSVQRCHFLLCFSQLNSTTALTFTHEANSKTLSALKVQRAASQQNSSSLGATRWAQVLKTQ